MKKVILTIWSPLILGILLLIVTKIDLYQFSSQSVEIKTMLLRELPIVLFGLILSAMIFLSTIYWLFKREWLIAVQAFISPLSFVLCFNLGGSMGGAFLNAA